MEQPNHHDLDVILKLYELRREERMRKAGAWLLGYKATNAAEHQAACPPGSDQDACLLDAREAISNPGA